MGNNDIKKDCYSFDRSNIECGQCFLWEFSTNGSLSDDAKLTLSCIFNLIKLDEITPLSLGKQMEVYKIPHIENLSLALKELEGEGYINAKR